MRAAKLCGFPEEGDGLECGRRQHECQQQGAIGDEMAVLPGVLKEEEAIKEKDELLREAQVEVA